MSEPEITQEWRAIADWPYEVSSNGEVRRLIGGSNCTKPGRLLKPSLIIPNKRSGAKPRAYVKLFHNGRALTRQVGILVAEAFLGSRPSGHQLNHKNGKPTDNRVENLEWVTPSQNARHAWDSGLIRPRRGEKAPHRRLTWEQVRSIRQRASEQTKQSLADEYGVNPRTIDFILQGVTWKETTP